MLSLLNNVRTAYQASIFLFSLTLRSLTIMPTWLKTLETDADDVQKEL